MSILDRIRRRLWAWRARRELAQQKRTTGYAHRRWLTRRAAL